MLQSYVFIRHVWTTHTHAHITYMHTLTPHMQTHGNTSTHTSNCTHSHITTHTHTLHTHTAHTHLHSFHTHTSPPPHTQIIQPRLEEIQNTVNQSVQCVLEIGQNIPLWTSPSPPSTKSVQCVSLLLSKSTSGSGTSHSLCEKTCTLFTCSLWAPGWCTQWTPLCGHQWDLPFVVFLPGYREGVLILL